MAFDPSSPLELSISEILFVSDKNRDLTLIIVRNLRLFIVHFKDILIINNKLVIDVNHDKLKSVMVFVLKNSLQVEHRLSILLIIQQKNFKFNIEAIVQVLQNVCMNCNAFTLQAIGVIEKNHFRLLHLDIPTKNPKPYQIFKINILFTKDKLYIFQREDQKERKRPKMIQILPIKRTIEQLRLNIRINPTHHPPHPFHPQWVSCRGQLGKFH